MHPLRVVAPAVDDVAITLLGALVLALITLAPDGLPVLPWLRAGLGAVFVVFVPGYFLAASLFGPTSLDGHERTALSIALSVALVPLTALVLDRLSLHINESSVMIAQITMSVMLAVVSGFVRTRFTSNKAELTEKERRLPPISIRMSAHVQYALLTSLLLGTASAAWIAFTPSTEEFMSEFYILGSDGKAENYQREVGHQQTLTITMGVRNLEQTENEYRLEIWAHSPWDHNEDQLIESLGNIRLARGQSWEGAVSWQMPHKGKDQQINLRLFNQAKSSDYLGLTLWIDVL